MIPVMYKNYIFNITVQDKESVSKYLSESGFSVYMMNPQYTLFMGLLRYFALIISIIVGIIYYTRIRRIRWADLVIESKLVLFLAILIALYNDPLFALTVNVPNRISIFITAFFTTNTLTLLIFFWLILYQRMVYEKNQIETNLITKTKLAIFSVSL